MKSLIFFLVFLFITESFVTAQGSKKLLVERPPEPRQLSKDIQPLNSINNINVNAEKKTIAMVVESIIEQDKRSNALPGQIMQDPDYPDKMVYNKDDNHDGQLDPFFLCGPGDPEGFLYRGTRNPDGTRNGDQMKLIGKLKKYGGNCIYLEAVRTDGGDAKNSNKEEPQIYPDIMHNPWINQNPKDGLNEKILDQWEVWFNEMDKNGIVIYFFIYDDQINLAKQFGWELDSKGNLNSGEKEFVQTLVRKFKHHKNLIWCIMEEGQEIGQNWQQHISKIAEAIKEEDNYNHIIASHQHSGNIFYHNNDPSISQFTIQTSKNEVNTSDNLHQWLLKAWENSEGRYSLNMSEDHRPGEILVTEGNRKKIRERNWVAAMAGSYSMVLGMDINNTSKTLLQDCRILQTFFEGTNFNQMHPNDLLASGETDYILANEGFDYILYSSHAGKGLGIKDLPNGTYSYNWVDCVDGKQKKIKNTKVQNGNQFWNKPSGFGEEVALYIHREDKRPEKNEKLFREKHFENKALKNIAPKIESDRSNQVNKNNESFIQLRYNDPDGGPGPYTITITSKPKHGTLSGTGNDRYYLPDKNYTGNDRFSWKVNDGMYDSAEAEITIIVK